MGSSYILGSIVELVSDNNVTSTPLAGRHSANGTEYPSSSVQESQAMSGSTILTESPNAAQLDSMPIGKGAVYHGPSKPPTAITPNTAVERPPTPSELEMSLPASPPGGTTFNARDSWNSLPINKYRIAGSCVMGLSQGFHDSASGPLIETIEQHYNVGYAVVSLIFVANALAYIVASPVVKLIDDKLGRARTLVACDLVCIAGYIMLVTTPPFPVYVLGYFVLGLGLAVSLALNNVYCANIAQATTILGFFHGSYGIGGTVAPLIATAMLSHGIRFSYVYFITMGLRATTIVLCGWAFRHFERDAQQPSTLAEHSDELITELQRISHRPRSAESSTFSSQQPHLSSGPAQQPSATVTPTSKRRRLLQSLANRTTLVGALFVFAYQGAEVSISGWIIQFLIAYRHGVPSKVGNVTAGFWAGITLSRLVMSHYAGKIGERLTTYILIAATIVLQLLVWFVPDVVGDAVAIALAGVMLGPIFPCATAVFTRLLPRRLQHTAIGFISSAGSSGGALAPFAVGLLSQSYGTFVLHPVCIALFVLMGACWLGLPKDGGEKRA